VTIGAGCVIGAHSVVTRDIPAYSVAVGSPARVVRRWDPEVKAWMKVD
jgi:acetyltransferase-like isoleucine patch superfamily enzyme